MKLYRWLMAASVCLITGGFLMQADPAIASVRRAEVPAVPAYTTSMRDMDTALRGEVVTGVQYRVQKKHDQALAKKLAAEARAEARADAAEQAALLAREAARRAAKARAATPPSPPPASAGPVGTGGMSAFEACVIQHESGGDPTIVNASSGAGGLFQFLPSTWASLGFAAQYPGGAQTAPVSVQEAAFTKLYDEAGTSPWAPYDGC